MIDWEAIDKMRQNKTYMQHDIKERGKIAPSVQKILNDFDEIALESMPTEETFHSDSQKAMDIQKRNYLQKALGKTLLWQSFCRANT